MGIVLSKVMNYTWVLAKLNSISFMTEFNLARGTKSPFHVQRILPLCILNILLDIKVKLSFCLDESLLFPFVLFDGHFFHQFHLQIKQGSVMAALPVILL